MGYKNSHELESDYSENEENDDPIYYCFRGKDEGNFGIVWRSGEDSNDNEYLLLAGWIDEDGAQNQAEWVITGDWEIKDIFEIGEKLEKSIKINPIPPGLRLKGFNYSEITTYVSNLNGLNWGLRFGYNSNYKQLMTSFLNGNKEYGAICMPKNVFYALIELIKDNPIVNTDTQVGNLCTYTGSRGKWICKSEQWKDVGFEPLENIIVNRIKNICRTYV